MIINTGESRTKSRRAMRRDNKFTFKLFDRNEFSKLV